MYCKLWFILCFGETEMWLALTLFQSHEVRNSLEGPTVTVTWWFFDHDNVLEPQPSLILSL